MTGSQPVPDTAIRDHGAIRSLFADQYGPMVRLAQYLSGDPDSGEEIAQEAFVVLLRRMGTLSDPSAASAYLRRVVVNLSRSRARRRRVMLRYQPRLADGEGDPHDHSVAVDERRTIIALLVRLPRRQRECLVLRYYLDLTEAEIANALGLSRGSVKTHCSRAIATLARALGERP